MVELGMAIAWGKPVFLFRDDFRRCTDSEAYPLNLMVFAGLPEAGWEAYWYGSVGEIADPVKARTMAEGRRCARTTADRRPQTVASSASLPTNSPIPIPGMLHRTVHRRRAFTCAGRKQTVPMECILTRHRVSRHLGDIGLVRHLW